MSAILRTGEHLDVRPRADGLAALYSRRREQTILVASPELVALCVASSVAWGDVSPLTWQLARGWTHVDADDLRAEIADGS